jgi:hypothetical protein
MSRFPISFTNAILTLPSRTLPSTSFTTTLLNTQQFSFPTQTRISTNKINAFSKRTFTSTRVPRSTQPTEPTQQPQTTQPTSGNSVEPNQAQFEQFFEESLPHAELSKKASPRDILLHDPHRIRLPQDNLPGLRQLEAPHPDQFAKNAQFMLHGSIYGGQPTSARIAEANPKMFTIPNVELMPDLANLGKHTLQNKPTQQQQMQQQRQRLITKAELTDEEKQAKHRKNIKKLTALALCIGVVLVFIKHWYEKKGAVGADRSQNHQNRPKIEELDHTTDRISNANHSVSPLAEEIINDMIINLKTANDHFRYYQAQKLLLPIYNPENASKLPLLVAKAPTHVQTLYNLQRHEQEMKGIYPNPPLNNKNVEFYLNDVEKLERNFRQSHESGHVFAEKPKNVQGLGDRIAFELQIRRD